MLCPLLSSLLLIPLYDCINLPDLRCNLPLGMEDGRIPDTAITASSTFDHGSVGPHNSRGRRVQMHKEVSLTEPDRGINSDEWMSMLLRWIIIRQSISGGAWCPKDLIGAGAAEWLQIDLGAEHLITGIETQGRHADGAGREFTPAYSVEYIREGLEDWVRYKGVNKSEVLRANDDTHTAVRRDLRPFVAAKLRIIPYSDHKRVVCLRVELHGCKYRGSIRSYAALPAPAKADTSYDSGLGLLTDSALGNSNIEDYHWVGWKNGLVQLHLNLTQLTNVTAILLHSNNDFKHKASIFTRASVRFSHDCLQFNGVVQTADITPDFESTKPRWIRLSIPHRAARCVRIELEFDNDWLLLSEVVIEGTRLPLSYRPPSALPPADMAAQSGYSVSFETSALIIGLIATAAIFTAAILLTVYYIHKRSRLDRKYMAMYSSGMLFCKSNETIVKNPTRVQLTASGAICTLPLPKRRSQVAPARPSGVSPPPAYDSNMSIYAEPDSLVPSSSTPLLANSSTPNSSTPNRATLRSRSSFTPYGVCSPLLVEATVHNDNIVPIIPKTALRVLHSLGQGQFGEVTLCELRGRLVAVKSPRNVADPSVRRDFEKEIRALHRLRHENIVQLLGVSEEGGMIVVEYMNNGELSQYLRMNKHQLSLSSLLHISREIAQGMAFLERERVIHRDLAARNCLVDERLNVKIADFGMSHSLYSHEYYKVEGCFVLPIRWMAWESLLMGTFSTSSDVWSFGVTLWEVFTFAEHLPFQNMTQEEVVANAEHCRYEGQMEHTLHQPPVCPQQLYNHMLSCWTIDPQRRPTFIDAKTLLSCLIDQNTDLMTP